MSPSKYYPLILVLLLGAYVGAFYLLPLRSLGGGFPPPKNPTFTNVSVNCLFYPMRWATQRRTHQYDATVGTIDFNQRQILLLVYPNLGYFIPFRERDDATIRSLQPGDRIQVTLEELPNVYFQTCHDEFRSYTRLK